MRLTAITPLAFANTMYHLRLLKLVKSRIAKKHDQVVHNTRLPRHVATLKLCPVFPVSRIRPPYPYI